MMKMNIQSHRLADHFEHLSKIGKIGETGVCRPTLSTEEKQAFDLVGQWMEHAGMQVRIDAFCNLIGRFPGKDPEAPVLMIGSHLDSQPYGGRFDGPAGVLGGVEVVMTMKENGIIPNRSIEVVAFCDEEGWRFGKGLFGSRGITGKLEEGELERTDKDGMTRREALHSFGCDSAGFVDSVYPPESIFAYLELHIKQGPTLDRAGLPLGIVSGISGPLWLTVTLEGFASRAGSVPMLLRQDALLGAAEAILALNEIVRREPGAETVGTVGSLRVFPDSRNIIPEEVSFSVDLRDIDLTRRNRRERQFRDALKAIAEKHHLTYDIREDFQSEPRYCAHWIKETIQSEAAELGLKLPELMSGPFHDALSLSYVCDYGMIFVRCKDGISHNPAEFSSYEDLALGTELLYKTVVKMVTG